ncbi:MAG: GtrA family protein [Candidatus Sulfotelmatobacter sp.]
MRWLKFNAVGGVGINVQLAVLLVLNSGFHMSYLPATAFAVEMAVLHNFLWHERPHLAGPGSAFVAQVAAEAAAF